MLAIWGLLCFSEIDFGFDHLVYRIFRPEAVKDPGHLLRGIYRLNFQGLIGKGSGMRKGDDIFHL